MLSYILVQLMIFQCRTKRKAAARESEETDPRRGEVRRQPAQPLIFDPSYVSSCSHSCDRLSINAEFEVIAVPQLNVHERREARGERRVVELKQHETTEAKSGETNGEMNRGMQQQGLRGQETLKRPLCSCCCTDTSRLSLIAVKVAR
jgi:hypothetical protein